MTTAIKVLISGGGIAGSCLAYWLSRTSLPLQITIIERSTTPRLTGQAVDIREQAVSIIEQMSLKEAILAKNTTETGTALIGADGKIVGLFEVSKNNISPTSEFEILRGDLAEILLNAAKSRGNIQYVYGEMIKDLTQDREGVSVTFTGGKTAEKYDLVVGADGSRSKTRTLAFDPAATNPYHPLGMYVAYFSIPSRPSDAEKKLWYWYNAPKGRVVMIRPHQDPKTVGAYLCVTMPKQTQRDPAIDQAMELGNDEVKKLFKDYFVDAGWETERVLEGMETAEDFYVTAWDQVRIPKWTTGQIALIGDAAVATPGVGTTYAIEGAYFLAGELSKIKSADEIPQALEDYEKNLRPFIDQAMIPGVFQYANPQTAWGIYIKNTLVWAIVSFKIPQLVMWVMSLFPGKSKKNTLPDYKWIE